MEESYNSQQESQQEGNDQLSSQFSSLSLKKQPYDKKSNLYKTEFCRSMEESGTCRYGNKCQFAHSESELRLIDRHPKYKTQMCKTFWDTGMCPYGKRCCFIHTLGPSLPGSTASANHTPSFGQISQQISASQTSVFGSLSLPQRKTSGGFGKKFGINTSHQHSKSFSSFDASKTFTPTTFTPTTASAPFGSDFNFSTNFNSHGSSTPFPTTSFHSSSDSTPSTSPASTLKSESTRSSTTLANDKFIQELVDDAASDSTSFSPPLLTSPQKPQRLMDPKIWSDQESATLHKRHSSLDTFHIRRHQKHVSVHDVIHETEDYAESQHNNKPHQRLNTVNIALQVNNSLRTPTAFPFTSPFPYSPYPTSFGIGANFNNSSNFPSVLVSPKPEAYVGSIGEKKSDFGDVGEQIHRRTRSVQQDFFFESGVIGGGMGHRRSATVSIDEHFKF